MKPKKAIIYLIITFMLGIIIVFSFYHFVVIDSRQSYDMQLEVSDHGGFNTGTDKFIYFQIKFNSPIYINILWFFKVIRE